MVDASHCNVSTSLLQHLDKAYSCARYTAHFRISREDLVKAFALSHGLQQQSCLLMERLLTLYGDGDPVATNQAALQSLAIG